jgi:tyrosyl-tRNA synthetase
MKHFQDLGHTVVFVVGDFTAMIGDPTGRSKTRPPLTTSEIERNAETYKTQVFKLLDSQKTVVEFNSRWLIPLGSDGLVKLAANYNVAQMLERRDFKQRYESGQPIAVHEFLYSLVQAFDSVALRADVELGGTDQLFNLNVGRDIMPAFDLPPQIVMTTPLLEGLDGVEKMSKSLDNYVGVTDVPVEMFGKLMSISDTLMWRYYLLLTDLNTAEIDAMKAQVASGALHPKQAKVGLATRIVTQFHTGSAAEEAAREFERVHAKGELPSDLRDVRVDFGGEPSRALTRVMVEAGLAPSTSDAGRRIQQGGVKLDGQKVDDVTCRVQPSDLPVVLQTGRHAVRLVP